jgi:hypothetical protein
MAKKPINVSVDASPIDPMAEVTAPVVSTPVEVTVEQMGTGYNYPISDLRFHKKPNGAKILQGLYGSEWKDIPSVDE